jgi:DNA-binding NarL/FixJ family response regulator
MLGTRVVLADDHTLLLDALKRLLENEFEIVGTFPDGLSVTQGAPALRPDVIVLDIAMPILNGLTAGQRLKQLLPKVKLIYLTMDRDPDMAAEAFRHGAAGYLLKDSAASELVKAIRRVARGGSYVTPLLLDNEKLTEAKHFKNQVKTKHLTLRQKEVLQLLAEGRSMKEAGFILNISPRTVAFHKYTIMERLNIKTSAGLVQYAFNHHVLAA